jgi:6-phosphogluconolactonase
MELKRHDFQDGVALAVALAARVAGALSEGIAARGIATIAVSGGSTPKAFFKALSGTDIAWDKVTITLVDERFVPAENPRSNHGLASSLLLQNKAAAARFMPLYYDADNAEKAATIASDKTADLCNPFDVVILGMGNDGHTASFFPGGSNLNEALDANRQRGILTMEADGAGEPRLTFSFSALQDARFLALHIEGAEKASVLEKALTGQDELEMPIRAVLHRATSPVEVFWAP